MDTTTTDTTTTDTASAKSKKATQSAAALRKKHDDWFHKGRLAAVDVYFCGKVRFAPLTMVEADAHEWWLRGFYYQAYMFSHPEPMVEGADRPGTYLD